MKAPNSLNYPIDDRKVRCACKFNDRDQCLRCGRSRAVVAALAVRGRPRLVVERPRLEHATLECNLPHAAMLVHAPCLFPMLLHCPMCGGRHIDEGEFATKPHHTHACQHCGHTWRPAIVNTVGVQFLPGFKNE
jgi:hypothetical protein